MAFISKVVFMLLLLSTLAWVDVSSDGSVDDTPVGTDADTFLKGLPKVNTISKELKAFIKTINVISGSLEGSQIPKMIYKHNALIRQNVANLISAAKLNPPMSERDGQRCAEGLATNVAVEKDFLSELIGKVSNLGLYSNAIEDSLKDFEKTLVSDMVDRPIFPPTARTAISNLVTSLMDTALKPAIEAYNFDPLGL